MRAVIDRFEGSYAIVLFGDREIEVDIPSDLLPKGAKEGDILKVNFDIDQSTTDAQREKIESLLHKLKNKNT